MSSPPAPVDELLQLIDFLFGQLFSGRERREESGQGAVEGVLHKFFAPQREEILSGDQGADDPLLVLKDTPVTQPF